MKKSLREKLDRLSIDFATETGEPFNHFYCPLLLRDEVTELTEAHIINNAFPKSARKCTVQRSDIDGFYGSKFEADFIDAVRIHDMSASQILSDKSLCKKFSPKLFLNGTAAVDYFYGLGERLPPGSMPAKAISDDHVSVPFVLRMSSDQAYHAQTGNWEMEISGDMRIAMVVSVLKSAYLTLFDMLGYRYARSPAGIHIGHDLLGTFFLANRNKAKAQITGLACPFFRECGPMIRPLIYHSFDCQGTVKDGLCLVCRGTSGSWWAIIVFVKTGNVISCALLPTYHNASEVETFQDFINSDREDMHASFAQLNGGVWTVHKDAIPLKWTKSGLLYPEC
jgi:hypothetical protein